MTPVTDGHNGPVSDETRHPEPASADTRFTPTGDVRVDEVIAQLPDPRVHHDDPHGGYAGAELADDSDHQVQELSGALPDPSLLDEHIAAAAAVHRQLQQRLSDLSG